MDQCEAAEGIRLRFGLAEAFDYVVGEKLLNFAEAAARDPDFARELPRFVSRVRSMFTADEIRSHLARIECARREPVVTDDELDHEDPGLLEERHRQFELVKELLTVPAPRYFVTPNSRTFQPRIEVDR